MEIILRETIDSLGRAGEVVKVADGYARNYLLRRKLAYPAPPGNLKVIEFERKSLLRKEAKQKEYADTYFGVCCIFFLKLAICRHGLMASKRSNRVTAVKKFAAAFCVYIYTDGRS